MVHLLDHRRAAAPDRQNRQAVGVGEAHFAKGLAHHVTGRRQRGLDNHQVLVGDDFHRVVPLRNDLQPFFLSDLENPFGVALEKDDVLLHELSVAPGEGDFLLVAQDSADLEVEVVLEVGLGYGLPGKRRPFEDFHLGDVLLDLIRLGKGSRLAFRQQVATDQGHVDDAGDQNDDADRGEMEHGERFAGVLLEQFVHQDVGRGADQGADAAEQGAEGQRHEQL